MNPNIIAQDYFKFELHDKTIITLETSEKFNEVGLVIGSELKDDGLPVYAVKFEDDSVWYFVEKHMSKCELSEIVDVNNCETGDNVEHPNHYCIGGIETIEYIRTRLTPEQFKGYCLGNILKYSSRANFKGKFDEDLDKARMYHQLYKELG